MTRPSFNSVDTIVSDAAVSTLAIPKPAGAVKGKAWIIQGWTNANRTFTTPSGFVPIGTNGAAFAAFIRMCDGTESGVNFAWAGGATSGRAISHVWNDVDPDNPILVAGTWGNAINQTSQDGPSITVPYTIDNDLLVSALQNINNTKVVTIPGSMTQAFQNNTTSTEAAAFETAAPGASGVRTWTWTGISQMAVMNFVLKGTPIPQSVGMLSESRS